MNSNDSIKQIAGGILIAMGIYFILMGISNSTGKFEWEEDRLISLPGETAVILTLRRTLRDNPSLRKFFNTEEDGALQPLGLLGLIMLVTGAVMVISVIRRRVLEGDLSPVGDGDGEVEEVDMLISPGILMGDGDNRDLSDLGESLGHIIKYREIHYMVSIAQGELDEEHSKLVIKIYRPDLVKYFELFSPHSLSALAIQVTRAVILRHHRQTKGTSAQQFRAQDDRIRQCENEVIARRYMPASKHLVQDTMRGNLGKVFAMHEQDTLQQESGSESDEWMDLSLQNAVVALSASVSQDAA